MSSFFYETKSGIYFYQGSLIIVSYFELLCNYPKWPQTKNYKIQGVNRFSKFYFTKIKTVGTPTLNTSNPSLFGHTRKFKCFKKKVNILLIVIFDKWYVTINFVTINSTSARWMKVSWNVCYTRSSGKFHLLFSLWRL